jgi:hypothetical protein
MSMYGDLRGAAALLQCAVASGEDPCQKKTSPPRSSTFLSARSAGHSRTSKTNSIWFAASANHRRVSTVHACREMATGGNAEPRRIPPPFSAAGIAKPRPDNPICRRGAGGNPKYPDSLAEPVRSAGRERREGYCIVTVRAKAASFASAGAHQHLGHLAVALRASQPQRRIAIPGFDIRVGPVLHKQQHHRQMSLASGHHQGRYTVVGR